MTFTSTAHDWTAPDGVVFSCSEWASKTPTPRAILVAVHGLSGAALDFEPLGRHLSSHGVTTLAMELRGQGNDPVFRRRGDLEHIEDWFEDLRAFLALVRAANPGVPLFYYGESMGAALLTRFLAVAREEEQPEGLILASPVVAIPHQATWGQGMIFRFLTSFLPSLRINVRKLTKPKPNQPPAYVTRNEAHRKWFETAPHRVDRFTRPLFQVSPRSHRRLLRRRAPDPRPGPGPLRPERHLHCPVPGGEFLCASWQHEQGIDLLS